MRGSMRSLPFTPPAEPRRPEEDAPKQVELFSEPTDPVLILGEMFRDLKLIEEKLKALPFAADGYRGDLRVIAGAAKRTLDRASRLIGEDLD